MLTRLENKLKEIVKFNEEKLKSVDWDQNRAEGLIDFTFEGMSVWNPLKDETLLFSVNPIDYYGKENIEKFIAKFESN